MSHPPSPSAVSPVSPRTRGVLELFEDALGDVAFPGIDAGALAIAASRVTDCAEHVLACEAQLAEARRVLAEESAALERKTERAVAYARVYAEEDEALATRLADLPAPARARSQAMDVAKSRRKPRSRKARDAQSPSPLLGEISASRETRELSETAENASERDAPAAAPQRQAS